MFKTIIRAMAIFTVVGFAFVATGCGGDESHDKIADYVEQARSEACPTNKIVAASQTTRTNGHVDPVNGLLITCENGDLVWIH